MLHALDHLARCEAGAVEDDGVRGGDHWRQGALGVAAVALVLGQKDFLQGGVHAAGEQFAEPAA